jgi:molybdopterin synthase sulfur carrier subunit
MKVLYFAYLRDRTGVGEETVTPPPEVRTVSDLVAWLSARSEGHARAFAQMAAVRVAVNQEYARMDRVLAPGDEVAFFPPVTGGRNP